MPEKIAERTQIAISERVFPGCVIGIVRDGHTQIFPFGDLTYDDESPEVNENTIYDVASITKSLPTSSLALLLISKGKFALKNLVREYTPELKNDFGATIEDLLRYRVRGVQMSKLTEKSPNEILGHIFETGFSEPPGQSQYTNLPAFLLGIIIERIERARLDELAEDHIFSSLGMSRTYYISPAITNETAPTEIDFSGKIIHAVPHDESARIFARAQVAAGHAGLFSTVPDLLSYLGALLSGWYPAVTDGAKKGLGWQVNEPRFMGVRVSPYSFGKTGFTGTSIVVDLKKGIGLAILSNCTFPKRPASRDAIDKFRGDIADIILGDT